MYILNLTVLGSMLFFFSACSHKIPEASEHKKPSVTQVSKHKNSLLDDLGQSNKNLVKRSAFYSLSSPTDAFSARLFLIDHATTSLDVQYYIYKTDIIGKVFSSHLLMAANRGVKVRILMDDLTTSGKDEQWQKLASHPNIELRLFNPNILRTSFRNLALLFNVNSLGKRMHNKSLIADGSAAIIGGRNIGDVYFAVSTETLFLDYDVLAVGKVVPDIYNAFDLYWNSKEAVPSEDILEHNDKHIYLSNIADLRKEIKVFEDSAVGKAMLSSDFNQKVSQKNLTFTVADQTDFYYDHPSKVSTDENDNTTHISAQISEDLKDVQKELIIISPYFIPSDEMMVKLKEARIRGVKVIIITNSLASTDVMPVYSGYQGYIKPLTEMGVELYELKPNSFKKFLAKEEWLNPNALSLHTKMMVIDNSMLGIGSANIDPRSDKLNTEIFMVINSKKVAKEARDKLNKVISIENFYRLSWGKHPKEFEDDMTRFGPIWHTMEEGKEKTYYSPPRVGVWKELATDFVSLLPIKGYL